MNDYHHLLQCHLNGDSLYQQQIDKQFKYIYTKIMNSNKNNNLLCDINQCKIFCRNHMENENDTYNDKYSNLMDCIHSNLLHSVDIGFNTIDDVYENISINTQDKIENIYYDKQLHTLRNYLKEKRNNLTNVRGDKRMDNNKFMTKLIPNFNETAMETDSKNDQMQQSTNEYSFGKRYDYWNKYGSNTLKPKYSTIKEEIISNQIFCLDLIVFDNALQKAMNLMTCSYAIKMIKCTFSASKYRYDVEPNMKLGINNILSVILYTDYDSLSYKFSCTFRQIKPNETYIDLRNKNKEYGNWCKCLTETVNCYGTEIEKTNINTFYHGVSFMYFKEFIAKFNSPTSTTSKLQIAMIFTNIDGIILELNKYSDGTYYSNLRYFNCSLLSRFPYEDERLFIQPPPPYSCSMLQFKSIRNMKTNENYKMFIQALVALQKIINDKTYSSKPISIDCMDVINNLIDLSNISSQYIIKSFKKWTEKIKQITLCRNNIKKYAIGLNIWETNTIQDKIYDNLIQYDKLNNVFKQTKQIWCYNIGAVNASYLESLLSILTLINNLKDSLLNEICLCDVEVMYSTSEFQKYVTCFAKNNWELKKKGFLVIKRAL
eukprot:417473_1